MLQPKAAAAKDIPKAGRVFRRLCLLLSGI